MTEKAAGKEIMDRPETMPANSGQFDNGLGELDQGDLIIPRLTINQPTTPDIKDIDAGKFAINITGDTYDKMSMVIIKLSKSRILFPEKYKRDNELLCRSFDFQVPSADIKEPMCDSCGLLPLAPGEKKAKHKCQYANWGAKGEAPRCQEVWDLLVVDLETYMPMFFSLKSTALKPLRKIVSAISMISTAKRIPMWGMKFDVATEKTSNDSGTFYLPVFNGLANIEAADRDNMKSIRQQLANVSAKDAAEKLSDEPPPAASEEQEEF